MEGILEECAGRNGGCEKCEKARLCMKVHAYIEDLVEGRKTLPRVDALEMMRWWLE